MSTSTTEGSRVKFAIPKGRMQEGVVKLLGEGGIKVTIPGGDRSYRAVVSGIDGFDVKLLKPQNIVEMLHVGTRDVGFAGYDWVVEKGFEDELVELLDTGLDKVRIVAACPDPAFIEDAKANNKPLRIASEYSTLCNQYIKQNGINAQLVRAYGATEIFPPDDADMILDNTSTGSTLKANGLEIIGVHMRSSTRLYANKAALANPEKKAAIDQLVLLLKSVLNGRQHKMLDFNIDSKEQLDAIIDDLPCMRAPTVSELYHTNGYAVRVCVLNDQVPKLIFSLKEKGARDIVVSKTLQICE